MGSALVALPLATLRNLNQISNFIITELLTHSLDKRNT